MGNCEKVFYEVYKRGVKDFQIKIISSYDKKRNFPKNRLIFEKNNSKNKLLRYFYYTLHLSSYAKKGRPDLIHANNIECIRLSKKPFVLTIHHVGHFIDPAVRKQTLFNKLMGRVLVMQAMGSSLSLLVHTPATIPYPPLVLLYLPPPMWATVYLPLWWRTG